MTNTGEEIKAHRKKGRVLVLGASGYVGSYLVPHLVSQGYHVRASSRDYEKLQTRNWHGVEIIASDLLKPESLYEALDDVEQIIYLVHSMTAGDGYMERDHVAALNLAIAARKSGVKHIIYLGSLTSKETRSAHLLSREQTGTALRSTDIPVTEMRAPIIIGPGSVPYEVMRDVVNQLPFIFMPKQMSSRSCPIALKNLLVYVSAPLDNEALVGQNLDLAGPDYLSYADLMKVYAKRIGKSFKLLMIPLPIWIVRYTIPLFSTAPAGIIKALLGGLSHDIESDPSLIREQVPQKLLSVEQAIAAAEQMEQDRKDNLDWCEGNMIYRLHNSRNCFYGERITVQHSLDVNESQVWKILATIGGDKGYFFFDSLWRIRGWIDALCGGPGMTRLRDNPTELYSGERIDTWIIMEAKKNSRLLLKFEMRSPGGGCLEFNIKRISTVETQLTVTAYWHPRGLWGRLYWISFKPAHLLLFHGMSRRILRLAQYESSSQED